MVWFEKVLNLLEMDWKFVGNLIGNLDWKFVGNLSKRRYRSLLWPDVSVLLPVSVHPLMAS